MADDIKDIRDLSSEAAAGLKEINSVQKSVNKTIQEMGKGYLDLNDVADALAQTMKDLPKDIIKGSDLLKRAAKEANLLAKVREKGEKLLTKEIEKRAKLEGKSLEETNFLVEKATGNYNKLLDAEMKSVKLSDKIKLNWLNVSNLMDSMGENIKSPALAGDRLLAGMSALPNKIRMASEKAGGFGKLMKGVAKNWKVFAKGGIVAVGLMALIAPIILVWKAFKQLWEFIDKKVMPAQAALNKTMGAGTEGMGNLRSQAVKTGVRFEMLGKTFQEGAAAVTGLADAMMTAKIPDENLDSLLKMSEYVGAGAEATGKFGLYLKKTTGSLDDADKIMKEAAMTADGYGVSWNQVRKDIIQNTDILARFGNRNTLVMAEATAKSRHYGLTISDVNKSFGKQMDTFEGTSVAAAKLNTIFGTQINSMKLMMETDPTKRMEMLREELLKQGKTWDNLSVFEKNVITQSLGVEETQAALILSSEKRRKQLEAQANQQKRMNRINEEWRKGLAQIQQILVPWIPLIEKIMRSIANLTARIFGFKTGADPIRDVAKAANEAAIKFDKWLNSIDSDTIENFRLTLKGVAGDFGTIANIVKSVADAVEKLFVVVKVLPKIMNPSTLIGDWEDIKESFSMEGLKKGGFAGMIANKLGINLVDDAIITKKGEVVKVNPQDNIIATKAPVDPRKPMIGTGGRSEEIIHVHLHMDGKEIAETQVRRARLG